MGGAAPRDQGKELALETLRSGKALEKMKQIIEAQGGDPNIKSDDIQIGQYTADIFASTDGYVMEFDNKWIIEIARLAGAPNDKGAGVAIHKRGEQVKGIRFSPYMPKKRSSLIMHWQRHRGQTR